LTGTILLSLALGVPVLIGRFAPPRWRWLVIGLWVLAPLLVLLAMAGLEFRPGQASAADRDGLLFGLLLIGSFTALPWLIACALGFAAGLIWWGRATRAPESSAPAVPSVQSPMPSGGWQAVHVGFEQDGLVIDGLPVWTLPWRGEGATVHLAHPAHPGQLHAFDIYRIDDGRFAVRFAATELSNGVWGFYRWADAPEPFRPAGGHGSIPRTGPRSVLVALAILVATLVAIAGATLLTLRLQGEPPRRKLDTVPAFPLPQNASRTPTFPLRS
jgi:hypothetical protein